MANKKFSAQQRLEGSQILSRSLCLAYVLAFSLVHILFFRNGFFDINRSKYYLLIYSVPVVCGLGLLTLIAEHILRQSGDKPRLSMPDLGAWGAIGLALAAGVSVLLSPDRTAALTGSGGRYAGALFYFACVALYFIARFAHGKEKWPIIALGVSGGLCALLGVLNFFKIDPLGFYVPELKEIYHNDFISTIGNINFFSAYMCLLLGISAGNFIRTRGRHAYFWLIIYTLASAGVLVSRSESGMIGFASVFLGVCIFKPRSMLEAGRVCVLLGAFGLTTFVMGLIAFLCGPATMEQYAGIATTLLHKPVWMLALSIAGALGAAFFCTRRENAVNVRRLRIFCNGILIFAGIVLAALIALMVYFTALRPDLPAEGPLAYFRMDKNWGTFRGFIWKKTVVLYRELPLMQKLFGVGPDCLKPLLVEKCYDEMVKLTGILFDNAHNEYLQLLITTGAAGLTAWLCMISGAFRNLAHRAKKNPALFACALALTAHFAQALFNIAQPETTPAVFVLLALASRKERKIEK